MPLLRVDRLPVDGAGSGRIDPTAELRGDIGITEQLVLDGPRGRGDGVALGLGVLRRHVQLRFHVLVQEVVELEVLLLRDGIELVVVALGAGDGQAEPGPAHGVHPVDDGLDAELLGFDAAFHVHHRVPEEARGDLHVRAARSGPGLREQISGELFAGELVEGFVLVERPDDPIAPRPDAAGAVLLEAVGIGVAGGVQPPARPLLAVVR